MVVVVEERCAVVFFSFIIFLGVSRGLVFKKTMSGLFLSLLSKRPCAKVRTCQYTD